MRIIADEERAVDANLYFLSISLTTLTGFFFRFDSPRLRKQSNNDACNFRQFPHNDVDDKRNARTMKTLFV